MVKPLDLNSKLNFGKELIKWDKYLNNLSSSNYFKKLKRFLKLGDEENKFYPMDITNVFKPFNLVNPEQLKVVILTDTIHISSGLPYGYIDPNTKYENKEINKIERSIEIDFKNGLNLNFDPSLESWAFQGVLFLNSSLVYNNKCKDEFYKVWENFNKLILKSLAKNKTGIHYVFIGESTNKYKQYINIQNNYCYNIEKPEDSKDYIDFNVLNKINNNIMKQNGYEEKINWTDYE